MNGTKKLYVANYFDGESDNYFLFVDDVDATGEQLEAHFKRAYLGTEGNDIDDADINGVYKVAQAFDYENAREYKVNLELI